jgi:hypothetical protein
MFPDPGAEAETDQALAGLTLGEAGLVDAEPILEVLAVEPDPDVEVGEVIEADMATESLRAPEFEPAFLPEAIPLAAGAEPDLVDELPVAEAVAEEAPAAGSRRPARASVPDDANRFEPWMGVILFAGILALASLIIVIVVLVKAHASRTKPPRYTPPRRVEALHRHEQPCPGQPDRTGAGQRRQPFHDHFPDDRARSMGFSTAATDGHLSGVVSWVSASNQRIKSTVMPSDRTVSNVRSPISSASA